MINKAHKLFLAAAILVALPASSMTLDELNAPQGPAYRLGTSQFPEQVYKVTDSKKDFPSIDASFEASAVKDLTYADLSLKKISKEVADEVDLDSEETLSDMKLLWIGAAQKSETVRFIVHKLANPDEEKPSESVVKKIIKPIATVGSLAGIGIGNPVAAVSAMMGSNVLGNMSVDDKDLNYKYSKVNDADMIVLIRKIEELQRKIVNYYFDYMASRASLIKADEIVLKRKRQFASVEGKSKDQILMTDAYYRSALQVQNVAKADFLSKRAALEQIVGLDAMAEFEDTLSKRK